MAVVSERAGAWVSCYIGVAALEGSRCGCAAAAMIVAVFTVQGNPSLQNYEPGCKHQTPHTTPSCLTAPIYWGSLHLTHNRTQLIKTHASGWGVTGFRLRQLASPVWPHLFDIMVPLLSLPPMLLQPLSVWLHLHRHSSNLLPVLFFIVSWWYHKWDEDI